MWTLTNTEGKVIVLPVDKIITIGRRNADLILENDNSISKSHAKIVVCKTDDPENELMCTIMDAGSKYGSFVVGQDNLKRISTKGYCANSKDNIRFGLQHHIFTVTYYKYVVLISRMNDKDKKDLSEMLQPMDGTIVDEWDPQCTHVTCSTVKLTEKITCALIAGLHIVTIDFWYEMADAELNAYSRLPKPANFVPKLDNSILYTDEISLLPDPRRKTLFKEKIFLYFDKEQFKVFSRIIKLAGGLPVLYDETWKPKDCCQNYLLVVQPEESSEMNKSPSLEFRAIQLRLSQEKLRTIPESEIPLAILSCSIEKYCNPRFKFDVLLKSHRGGDADSLPENSSKNLVEETQELSSFKHPGNKKSYRIIPESVPMNSQMESQMSCRSHPKTSTSVPQPIINKNNIIIPESASIDTQTSTIQSDKLRVMQVETVIPPIFSSRPTQSKRRSDDRPEISESDFIENFFDNDNDGGEDNNDTNDNDNDDDDNTTVINSQNKEEHCVNESLPKSTRNKRSINTTPASPTSKNEKASRKKRKLNCKRESNINSPSKEHEVETTSNRRVIGNDRTILNPISTNPNNGNSSRHHYFSRNSFDKPKCIIPARRLLLDDMYEWKTNK